MPGKYRYRETKEVDPKIIAYVNWKVFEAHPSERVCAMEKDWHDCVI